MNLTHDKVVGKKENKEVKLIKLQEYVVSVHEEGLNQVIWQTTFFYNIPTDEGRFNISKDVYKGELMSTYDVPTNEGDEDVSNQWRFLKRVRNHQNFWLRR